MPKDLKRILVHLSQSDVDELDAIASDSDQSRAQLIRKAINRLLQSERKRAARTS